MWGSGTFLVRLAARLGICRMADRVAEVVDRMPESIDRMVKGADRQTEVDDRSAKVVDRAKMSLMQDRGQSLIVL